MCLLRYAGYAIIGVGFNHHASKNIVNASSIEAERGERVRNNNLA